MGMASGPYLEIEICGYRRLINPKKKKKKIIALSVIIDRMDV